MIIVIIETDSRKCYYDVVLFCDSNYNYSVFGLKGMGKVCSAYIESKTSFLHLYTSNNTYTHTYLAHARTHAHTRSRFTELSILFVCLHNSGLFNQKLSFNLSPPWFIL